MSECEKSQDGVSLQLEKPGGKPAHLPFKHRAELGTGDSLRLGVVEKELLLKASMRRRQPVRHQEESAERHSA